MAKWSNKTPLSNLNKPYFLFSTSNLSEHKPLNANDTRILKEAFYLATLSRTKSNHPFGAVLGDDQGNILLRAENTVVTAADITAHAEVNLIRQASAIYTADFLANCTLYASTEPCPMCSGAIFWSSIGRVVYGLSEAKLYTQVPENTSERLEISCRDILQSPQAFKDIAVEGPYLEDLALIPHHNFWR